MFSLSDGLVRRACLAHDELAAVVTSATTRKTSESVEHNDGRRGQDRDKVVKRST